MNWTLKLPTLILGLLLWLVSFILAARGRVWIAAVLALAGVGFMIYSGTIKDWCVDRTPMSWGTHAWGGGAFGDCFETKGWWQP